MKYTIKPLEWEINLVGEEVATCMLGIYSVAEMLGGTRGFMWFCEKGESIRNSTIPFETLEAAKAAAEADWQARIKEALVPAQDWISVEERMPEESEDVLITNGFAVWEGYCRNGAWYDYVSDDLSSEKITHWQPMPEPPKEEQE